MSVVGAGAFTKDLIDEDEPSEDLLAETESVWENYKEEKENRILESDFSFSSSVTYPFTFCEVAFLMHKLYQCANRKFNLRKRNIAMADLGEAESNEGDGDVQAGSNKEDIAMEKNIEKISRMQQRQLSFVLALSCKNKERWRHVKDKIVQDMRIKEQQKKDKELLIMRISFLDEMGFFIAKEVEELITLHGNKKKKKKNVSHEDEEKMQKVENIIDKTGLKLNLDTIDKDRKEEPIKRENEKSKKKSRKEESTEKAFKMKEKEALGNLYFVFHNLIFFF